MCAECVRTVSSRAQSDPFPLVRVVAMVRQPVSGILLDRCPVCPWITGKAPPPAVIRPGVPAWSPRVPGGLLLRRYHEEGAIDAWRQAATVCFGFGFFTSPSTHQAANVDQSSGVAGFSSSTSGPTTLVTGQKSVKHRLVPDCGNRASERP
jgi:hypothetical protein